MKKGDRVWFVDGSAGKDGGMHWYAEYGTLMKSRRDGACLVNSYFGDFWTLKQYLFETKEDCEKQLFDNSHKK